MIRLSIISIFAFLCAFSSQAQQSIKDSVVIMPYGKFDDWMVHRVKESFVIGGNVRETYEIIKADTLFDNRPFEPKGRTPWATSSAMAHVKGIYKASTTVFPEKRDDGYCVRMETRIEDVKVLGMVNLHVLATGTIYTGETIEPIKSADNPQSKISRGIPFSQRPKSLIFDYKVDVGGVQYKTSSNGFGSPKCLNLPNRAEVYLLLQHRWEDADGNIYANRVGTGFETYTKNQLTWVNNHAIPIYYGDFSTQPNFDMAADLNNKVETGEVFYAKNSKGEMTPIHELAWRADQEPTHMIIIFTSGNGGAFVGAPDGKFWIDNVKLSY